MERGTKMPGEPKLSGGACRPRPGLGAALATALAIAAVLAGCGRAPRVALAPPPDPPPIPARKPPAPAVQAPAPKFVIRAAPAPAAIQSAALSPAPVGLARPASVPFAYLVQAGDTVYGVSRKLGVPLRAVIDANVLSPPYILSIGQTLRVPNPRRHEVKRGETVYGISRAYGVEMSELVRLNGIDPPFTISSGALLVVPVALDAAETALAGVEPDPGAPPKLTPPDAGGAVAAQQAAAPATAKPARLAAIPKPPPRASSKFLWPAQGRLIGTFGPKQGGLHNDGINIAAPRGTPVYAAENGVVVYSGNELRGFGNLILVRHADGWVTAYAHTEEPRVERGQAVKRGQVIAKVGSSGNVSSPQLHFEIRKGSRAVDPRGLLGPERAAGAAPPPA